MIFDKIHSQRLTHLADHLEKEELNVDKFFFGNYYSKTNCGTTACALGECTFLWPERWKLAQLQSSGFSIVNFTMDNGYQIDSDEGAEIFFGLNLDEVEHLFYPGGSMPHIYGGVNLTEEATAKEVAAQIRAMLVYKAKQANSTI